MPLGRAPYRPSFAGYRCQHAIKRRSAPKQVIVLVRCSVAGSYVRSRLIKRPLWCDAAVIVRAVAAQVVRPEKPLETRKKQDNSQRTPCGIGYVLVNEDACLDLWPRTDFLRVLDGGGQCLLADTLRSCGDRAWRQAVAETMPTHRCEMSDLQPFRAKPNAQSQAIADLGVNAERCAQPPIPLPRAEAKVRPACSRIQTQANALPKGMSVARQDPLFEARQPAMGKARALLSTSSGRRTRIGNKRLRSRPRQENQASFLVSC